MSKNLKFAIASLIGGVIGAVLMQPIAPLVGKAMIELGWCTDPSKISLCQIGYLFSGLGVVLASATVALVAYLLKIPQRIWSRIVSGVSYIRTPKRNNLKLACNPISEGLVTLKIHNREWRYWLSTICATIEYSEPAGRDTFAVQSGALKWCGNFGYSQREISALCDADVEFIRINPSSNKFSISYGFTNSDRTVDLEFGVGEHHFTVHVRGSVHDRIFRKSRRFASHYDVKAVYSGGDRISVEVKNANLSYSENA